MITAWPYRPVVTVDGVVHDDRGREIRNGVWHTNCGVALIDASWADSFTLTTPLTCLACIAKVYR